MDNEKMIKILDRIEPVSYTHLDVYKRQGYIGNGNPNGLIDNPSKVEDKLFNAYVEEQRKLSILDYNDLINIFLYILIKFEDKRKKWQQKFQYIMCDEFNDIDKKQYQILMILSQYHKNLMIVGDPDQTIYSWRGSDVRYILNFDKDFENVKDIVVNTNYRSLPSILNLANSLIRNNKNRLDKDLIPSRFGNDKVIYKSGIYPKDEAEWIVEKIKELRTNGENLKDIAILYRNNRIARSFEEELRKNGIDYCIYCGIDFYSRKEIKDLISYLRFILYEKDIDFERIINVPKMCIRDIRGAEYYVVKPFDIELLIKRIKELKNYQSTPVKNNFIGKEIKAQYIE